MTRLARDHAEIAHLLAPRSRVAFFALTNVAALLALVVNFRVR